MVLMKEKIINSIMIGQLEIISTLNSLFDSVQYFLDLSSNTVQVTNAFISCLSDP